MTTNRVRPPHLLLHCHQPAALLLLLLQLPATDNQPTQLAWAHPQHGQVLAVGTRSGSVHILQGPSSLRALTATDPQRRRAGWSSTERLQCGKGKVR
jgi:hypothetical protein